MKKFGILKTVLFAIALSLELGCATLQDAPPIDDCQINGNPRAFYCQNTHTNAQEKRKIEDPRMKGGHALSAEDYRRMEEYVQYLINEAEQRCH